MIYCCSKVLQLPCVLVSLEYLLRDAFMKDLSEEVNLSTASWMFATQDTH